MSGPELKAMEDLQERVDKALRIAADCDQFGMPNVGDMVRSWAAGISLALERIRDAKP